MSASWVILVLLFSVKKVFSFDEDSNSITDDRIANISDNSASEIVKKVIAKGCAKKYTLTCFKMDMVQLVDLLSAADTYQIFPGMAVVKDQTSKATSNKTLPNKLIKSLASEFPLKENIQLDEFLISKISDYLSTHSISLRFMEPPGGINGTSEVSGRGKGNKGGYGSIMAGVMMMKGTLMTIGFGALAALAGKALMTGLLSLMLSAIIGLRSANGQPQRQTTYEIISKPLYSHSHTHSSEISHDHHDHGHGHSSYYGRNLDFDDENNSGIKSDVEYVQLPAREEEEDPDQPQPYHYNSYGNIEYKTITEDDLRAYYSNLDKKYANRPPVSYRNSKSLDGAEEKLGLSVVPVPALLNPELKGMPK